MKLSAGQIGCHVAGQITRRIDPHRWALTLLDDFGLERGVPSAAHPPPPEPLVSVDTGFQAHPFTGVRGLLPAVSCSHIRDALSFPHRARSQGPTLSLRHPDRFAGSVSLSCFLLSPQSLRTRCTLNFAAIGGSTRQAYRQARRAGHTVMSTAPS